MFEVRWHGRGGQGSFTGAKLLGVASAIYDERYAQAFPSFGPERRGAPVLGFNRLSDTPITDRSEIEKCDRIVFLDETLFHEGYLNDLKSNAIILINSQKTFADPRIISFDATGLAIEVIGKPIANTAMLGFLAAVSVGEISLEGCLKAIESDMKPSMAKSNGLLLKQAYELGKRAYDHGRA